VGLKEAALDSPTFRATSVHFSEQVDQVEKWLEEYLKATNRLIAESITLENVLTFFTSHAVLPNTITEAVLDQDYSILAMKRYSEGAKDFWMSTLAVMKRLTPLVVEPIRGFLQNDLKTFKDSRKALELYQKNLDNLLSKFAAQAKTKEPSSLREDAFQLHEARRAYLKASMDYCVLAPQLRTTIDKLLIGIFSDQWREMRMSRDNSGATFVRGAQEMERVKGWTREMENSDKAFKRELVAARKQLEETAELASRPSRELEDYAASTVPYLGHTPTTSRGNIPKSPRKEDVKKYEKQGWLYLRTFSGKPVRLVWVRRWAFVKNGIFGWLLQSTRAGGVEESERIGVLLCNVRPALQEERRFCFEVKTKNNAIMLQADTQAELMEWMHVFENAKSKALEDPASTDSFIGKSGHPDPAFTISPPSVPELGTLVLDTVNPGSKDDELTPIERNGTMPSSQDGGGDLGRKATGLGGEAGGLRDHAARAMSKVDLPRRSPANLTIGPPSTPAMGGIASLIVASHHSLPVGPGAPKPIEPEKPRPKLTFTLASRDMPPNTLAPSTLINPPAPTQLSKQAVVVSGERGVGSLADKTGGMPSGLLANMWGTWNWGYVNRLERGELRIPAETKPLEQPSPFMLPSASPAKGPIPALVKENLTPITTSATDLDLGSSRPRTRTPSPGKRNTISVDNESAKALRQTIAPQEYPNYYPLQLKTQDAQFRLLFPNVRKDEKLVLVFRATWNPNDQQEFPGRAYVTTHEIYFYSHHLGLVLASGVSLSTIDEVTAAPGKDCDFLFLHMRDVREDSGSTRITIKTFLEPLKLLQRRLNYLVRNSGADEPSDLETVIKTLIKMETQKLTRSSSSESWEDVSLSTPMDDGTPSGANRSRQSLIDLKAPIRVDRSLEARSGRYGSDRDTAKFKLPAQPVVYTPAGNLHKAVEKNFDISPKALFHVLFGDKSAVWQLLQHERRARDLKQGPWVSVGEGHLRRDFDFTIPICDSMFGSLQREVEVKDYQVVDVLNDHLCYVVTDKRAAWHLPYRRNFKIVSKIVITHLAKSKSKLAVFTKVEWVKRPWIMKGVVDRHAMDDLELDALDLVDLVTDQVRRLGPYSRTKKAIQIFGQVGQSTNIMQLQLDKMASNIEMRRTPVQRTLVSLLLQTMASLSESMMTSVLGIVIDLFRWMWKTCTANSVILTLLVVSVLANGFYSSRDGWAWWHERTASKFLARVGIGANSVMSKAVYVQDIDDAVATAIGVPLSSQQEANPCYSTFHSSNQLDDLDAPLSSDSVSSHEARRIQQTRRKLAIYRHDLLVAMRVVNSVEREVIQTEWESWVQSENRRCRQLGAVLGSEKNDTVVEELGGRKEEVKKWYGEYCDSCRREGERLMGRM
jgi:VAD1 Analog of StAR-related lipid transfer domain/BAR domain of APPL family/PH domain